MLELPELLDMVLSLLSIQDLARCALVNKQWCDLATPLLWRTISGSSNIQRKALQRTVLEDILRIQEHQEQHLRLEDVEQHQWPGEGPIKGEVNAERKFSSCRPSLWRFAPWIRNLDNPQFIFYALKHTTTMDNVLEFLYHFLKQCTNVGMLTLDIVVPSEVFYQVCMIIADSLAPNLRELSLLGPRNGSCFGMSSRWYLYMISRCSIKLEKLTIYNDPYPGYIGDIVSNTLPIVEVTFPGLKELILDHCWSKDELSMWEWFWRGCGNVERLELRACRVNLAHDLAGRIRIWLPKVNSIVIKNTVHRKAVAPLLSACVGGWKNIRTYAALDPMSCTALATQCGTLEVLEVITISAFSSKTLRRVLLSSPRLKTLITIDDKWCRRLRSPYIEANDFIDVIPLSNSLHPWASEKSLKVLKTKITCIPRPDVYKVLAGQEHFDTLTETYAGEGRHTQKRVHERLARLTNLEELCLGQATRANVSLESAYDDGEGEDYQYDCLEMTLESGLDQLKDLNNLRVLDV
ncbi:MAG: hypothetical protein JOS17DRAFT_797097 [Linnemannia elongata]|nr:MAG: hypothetical protein JOS17DRAFT_797097 [Linnemannia elongata]